MAVEQGESGLVRRELDRGAAVERDNHGVLNEACSRFSVDVDQLELVAVQVQRMGVVGAVAEGEAVTLAFMEDELVVVWVKLAVHREGVELACAAGDLLENHLDVLGRGAVLRRS